jgi:hypothetical protein
MTEQLTPPNHDDQNAKSYEEIARAIRGAGQSTAAEADTVQPVAAAAIKQPETVVIPDTPAELTTSTEEVSETQEVEEQSAHGNSRRRLIAGLSVGALTVVAIGAGIFGLERGKDDDASATSSRPTASGPAKAGKPSATASPTTDAPVVSAAHPVALDPNVFGQITPVDAETLVNDTDALNSVESVVASPLKPKDFAPLIEHNNGHNSDTKLTSQLEKQYPGDADAIALYANSRLSNGLSTLMLRNGDTRRWIGPAEIFDEFANESDIYTKTLRLQDPDGTKQLLNGGGLPVVTRSDVKQAAAGGDVTALYDKMAPDMITRAQQAMINELKAGNLDEALPKDFADIMGTGQLDADSSASLARVDEMQQIRTAYLRDPQHYVDNLATDPKRPIILNGNYDKSVKILAVDTFNPSELDSSQTEDHKITVISTYTKFADPKLPGLLRAFAVSKAPVEADDTSTTQAVEIGRELLYKNQ